METRLRPVDCLELRLLLLATGGHLVASAAPTSQPGKFPHTEKLFSFDEIVKSSNGIKLSLLNVHSVSIPRIPSNNFLICYKISSRKVNASWSQCYFFRTEIKEGVFGEVSLYHGNSTRRITEDLKTANILIGKSIENSETWIDQIEAKDNSLLRNIVVKFLWDVKVISSSSVTSMRQLQETRYPRRSGLQSTQFQLAAAAPNPANPASTLGGSVAHLAGLSSTTGQAVFCADMPALQVEHSPDLEMSQLRTLQGELHYAVVGSGRAHAKILSVDVREALALPGVHRFIGVRDVPAGKNRDRAVLAYYLLQFP